MEQSRKNLRENITPFEPGAVDRQRRMGLVDGDGKPELESVTILSRVYAGQLFDSFRDHYSPIVRMSTQAKLAGGAYMGLAEFSSDYMDTIANDIADQYRSEGQTIDKINVTGSLEEDDLLWLIAIHSVRHKQDLNDMSTENIQSFCADQLSYSTALASEDGGTTLTVAFSKLDPEAVMRRLGFTKEEKTWAKAIHEALSKSGALSKYAAYLGGISTGPGSGGTSQGGYTPPPLEPGDVVMGANGFVSPLGAGWQARVTSECAYRNCPFHGWELHTGLDMAAPAGTPIRAALAGTVIKSGVTGSYGNYTMIDHGGGLSTGYAHQSQRLVKVGNHVEAGQVIGLVGSTGNSTGSHLHLEVWVNGVVQNPRNYLPK